MSPYRTRADLPPWVSEAIREAYRRSPYGWQTFPPKDVNLTPDFKPTVLPEKMTVRIVREPGHRMRVYTRSAIGTMQTIDGPDGKPIELLPSRYQAQKKKPELEFKTPRDALERFKRVYDHFNEERDLDARPYPTL